MDSFLNIQLLTTRNYERENLCWLFLLGGFQYHSEHHLFPQVPFYHLRTVNKILEEELEVFRKGINYGPMLIWINIVIEIRRLILIISSLAARIPLVVIESAYLIVMLFTNNLSCSTILFVEHHSRPCSWQ